MIKSILTRLWPVAPFFAAIVESLKGEHFHFDLEYRHDSSDDRIILRAKTGLAAAFQLRITVEKGGRVLVTSIFAPEGYPLNWRERAQLREAVLDWIDDELDLAAAIDLQPNDSAFFDR